MTIIIVEEENAVTITKEEKVMSDITLKMINSEIYAINMDSSKSLAT